LDQAKAKDPEYHEAILNVKIDVEMSYEESASYFKLLDNLKNIRHTIILATLPVDDKKSANSRTGNSSKNSKSSSM
jgi:hypothetical protein